jgi:hypothetical protein
VDGRYHPSVAENLYRASAKPPPRPDPPDPPDPRVRQVNGTNVAIVCPILAVALAFPTLFVEAFADSPNRTTSAVLVGWLFLGALVGEVLGTIAIGRGIYLGGCLAGRRLIVAGALVTVLGIGCHAASLGLAFYEP